MLRSQSPSRRHLFVAVAGATLGIVGFCGVAHAQMKEVTFIVVNNLFSTPAFVAVENGYWAKQGLNVKIKLTASGSQVTKALQAGEAQFGHAALSTTIASARAGGNMLTGVMPYFNAAEYIALGGRAIIGRKDRGIDAANPKSMEGKKIGYLRGSTNDVYLRQWFKKNKLDISKSTLINLPVADMPISITQGVVDAVVPWEPYSSQAIRELGPNARHRQPLRGRPRLRRHRRRREPRLDQEATTICWRSFRSVSLRRRNSSARIRAKPRRSTPATSTA